MTYVAQFLHKYPELRSDSGDRLGYIENEYMELRAWLLERTSYLASLATFPENYSAFFADLVTVENQFIAGLNQKDFQGFIPQQQLDNMDQKESVLVDRFIKDTADRWKGVCMELKCVQSMLEELISFWRRWNTLSRELDEWMTASEPKLALDEEAKMEYFQSFFEHVNERWIQDLANVVQDLIKCLPYDEHENVLNVSNIIQEKWKICKLLDQVISTCETAADVQTDEGISRLLAVQEQAVEELDNQRSNVISMIQKGKDLGKDPSAPEFIKQQAISLETQWNKAYDTSLEKLNTLKATQKTWNAYNSGKSELLSLIEKAESDLRNVTRRYGGEKVAAELKRKQDLAVALRIATENLLSKLQFFCKELCAVHPQAQQLITSEVCIFTKVAIEIGCLTDHSERISMILPLIERNFQVAALGSRLAGTLSVVEQRIEVLQKEAADWEEFDSHLNSLDVWAVDTAPKEVVQFSTIAIPQEKLIRVQALNTETEVKKQNLADLKQRAQLLLAGKTDTFDLNERSKITICRYLHRFHSCADQNDEVCKGYVQRIKGLELSIHALEKSIEEGNADLQKGVATWQEFEAALDVIRPWLEKAEGQISTGIQKPVVLNDARDQLQQVKQQAKESIGARWNNFQELQDNLSQAILKSQSDIQDVIHSFDNCAKSEAALREVDAVLQGLVSRSDEKDFLIKEGEKLMNEDKKNTVVIQNILSSIELNWEKTGESIKESTIVLKELIEAWKSFKDHEVAAYSLLKEANARLVVDEPPTDLTSASDASARAEQAILLANKAKAEIDNMDNKLQIILRLSSTFPSLDCGDLEQSIIKARKNLNDVSKKAASEHQQKESQIVVWKQIDENKGDLLLWLEQKHDILTQCLQDLAHPDASMQHLNKYKNELPTYIEMRESIAEKTQQLAQLSDGFVSPNLAALETLINDQFQEVTRLADSVEASLSAMSDKENAMKAKVKKINDNIGKIRERVIQCNNLSGENDVILKRLKECRSLKDTLNKMDISSVEEDVNSFLEAFPSATQSSAVKEVNSLKNRHADVSNQAAKVEGNLLAFLIKYHTEKLSAFQRDVANYNDKLIWCQPEADNDRNSLETKYSSLVDIDKGLNECNKRQAILKASLEKLIAAGYDNDEQQRLETEQTAIFNNFSELIQKYNECSGKLSDLINVWREYDSQHEGLTIALKESEGDLKGLITTHTDLSTIDEKLSRIHEITMLLEELEPRILTLETLGAQLAPDREDSRVMHNINALRNKFGSLQKLANSYRDRLKGVKQKESVYLGDVDGAEKWISNANENLESFNQALSKRLPLQKYKPLLEQINEFNSSREHGHALINKAVESGEALFSEITPENREVIRNRLKNLRNSSEALVDKANAISKVIEHALSRRNSFDDCFTQVAQWIIETDKKLKDGPSKEPTVQDKKLALHQYRNLLQDIQSHESIFKQLQEKSAAFSDSDATKKLEEIEERYVDLNQRAVQKVEEFEKNVAHHEEYLAALEKSCDFLRTLISEEALSDKDGEETKLAIIENLLLHQPEGEALVKSCEELQKPVLASTDPSGHEAIINELSEHKEAWRLFLARCNNNVEKLRQLYSKWGKLNSDIEEAMTWVKNCEIQVKDQSLKSNHATKKQHLEKLKALDNEILRKGEQFSGLVSSSAGAESDIAEKASKLLSKYQSLRTQSKELMQNLENNVEAHEAYSKKCQEFRDWLASERDLINACDDTTGEKADIVKRIDNINLASKRSSKTLSSCGKSSRKSLKHIQNGSERSRLRSEISSSRTRWMRNKRSSIRTSRSVTTSRNEKSRSISLSTNRMLSSTQALYQLLHILSKEVINRWQAQVDDHKGFVARYNETSACLKPLEDKLASLETDKSSLSTKSSVLQSLASELEQTSPKMTHLYASADKLYSDTAAAGRETIRQQIRDIRTRWEALEDGIKAQQKFVEAHSIQWNSYQEALSQVLAWLDQTEKTLKNDTISVSTAHDIRCKLLKQKARLAWVVRPQLAACNHTQQTRLVFNWPQEIAGFHKLNFKTLCVFQDLLKIFDSRSRELTEVVSLSDHLDQDIVKMCEQAVADHEMYNAKYKEALDWVNDRRKSLDEINALVAHANQKQLPDLSVKIQDLFALKPNGALMLNALQDIVEKTCASTSVDGRDQIRGQFEELQQLFESTFDFIADLDRDLKVRISRSLLQAAMSHQQDIVKLKHKIESLSEKSAHVEGILEGITEKHSKILSKAQVLARNCMFLIIASIPIGIANCGKRTYPWASFITYFSRRSSSSMRRSLTTTRNTARQLWKSRNGSKPPTIRFSCGAIRSWNESRSIPTLNALQGEIRAKELEIDTVTEKAQQLYKPNTRSSHITELQHKYQQLTGKVKALEEKVRCEKIEVDNLKSKATEMLASGQQNPAATHAQQVLQKFDDISEKIK
ncbi:unnamed protein product, partial [Nesidiocoris tenuis]